MNDPIVDLIINIKNGYMSRKDSVAMSHSLYKMVVIEKLKKLGFIKEVEVVGDLKKRITVTLLYKNGEPAITGVQIFSTPGKREYIAYKKLKSVLGGMGYSFLSTPKGIMTDKESKKIKLGGELLFSLW
ncbi:30S ribosomal protein S8 [Candidatus Roizmanbacteria bacterium]|nr:30S ribosomal protein S8 [Candidatus Roizmanbacteria bacterium]